MGRKRDLLILEKVFVPPPEIPKTEVRGLLSKHLSAKNMRIICRIFEQFGERGKKLAEKLGPETLASKRGREQFFEKLPFFH